MEENAVTESVIFYMGLKEDREKLLKMSTSKNLIMKLIFRYFSVIFVFLVFNLFWENF